MHTIGAAVEIEESPGIEAVGEHNPVEPYTATVVVEQFILVNAQTEVRRDHAIVHGAALYRRRHAVQLAVRQVEGARHRFCQVAAGEFF